VQQWIKRKKSPKYQPDIDQPSEFGATWKQWWINMQPSWRKGESLLTRTLPENVDWDWETLSHGGLKGLLLVVMTLSWWISATKGDSEFDLELRNAIDDVKWVLGELVAANQNLKVPNKRTREADTEEGGPDLKK
jgi:hypothetical protein